MFPHEKLHVYGKSLAFVAGASTISASWSKNHAVVDQLGRASESLILNLADGARLRSAQSKLRALDYAIGSGLECAGCLDIARIKGLLGTSERSSPITKSSGLVRLSACWLVSGKLGKSGKICGRKRMQFRTEEILRRRHLSLCSVMKPSKSMRSHWSPWHGWSPSRKLTNCHAVTFVELKKA